jgi:hypothetical protein
MDRVGHFHLLFPMVPGHHLYRANLGRPKDPLFRLDLLLHLVRRFLMVPHPR